MKRSVLKVGSHCRAGLALLLTAQCCWTMTAGAQALLHRYSFTSDARDSVGTADGMIWGDATLSNGALGLSGIKPSYVDLPNDLLSSLSEVTFETWLIWKGGGAWQRIWDFGNSVQGEDVQGQADTAMWLSPRDGAGGLGFFYKPSGAAFYNVVRGPGLNSEFLHQVVLTISKAASRVVLYVDGVPVATNTSFSVGPMDLGYTFNNWLGHSQYAQDPDLNASLDEFRIYNGVLEAAAVGANFEAGPNMTGWGTLQAVRLLPQGPMTPGDSRQLKFAADYANVASIDVTGNASTSYSVSDPANFSVSASGVLTASVNAGPSVTVTANFMGKSDSQVIEMTAPVLLHRYSFNTDAFDSVGSAHATLQGSTIANGAAILSGVKPSYIDLPNDLFIDLTNATFEAWVAWNGGANWQRIWDFGNSVQGEDVQGQPAPALWLTPSDGTGLVGSYYNPGGTRTTITSAGTMSPGFLHHVVWTYDKANTTVRVYVNGREISVNTGWTVAPADMGPTFNNWLGHSQYSQDPDFDGVIDEFRIYDGALSPAGVATNYLKGPEGSWGALTGLRLQAPEVLAVGNSSQLRLGGDFANVKNLELTFEPGVTYSVSAPASLSISAAGLLTATGSTSVTADVVATYMGQSVTQQVQVLLPSAPPAVLVNRYSFTVDASDSVGGMHGTLEGSAAIVNNAVVMNGVEPSYVNLPNDIGVNLTNYTIETWVNVAVQQNWQRIFEFGNSLNGEDLKGGGTNCIFLVTRTAVAAPYNGAGVWMYTAQGVANRTNLTRTVPLPVNTTSHIVLTYNKLTTTAVMYVDGAPVFTNMNVMRSLADMGPTVNNWLGRSQFNDPAYNGSIDEFRIYTGVLTPAQVLANHAAGPDTMSASPVNLAIRRENGSIVISWPAANEGYSLESSTSLQPAAWSPVSQPSQVAGDQRQVTVPATGTATFYRLKK
jgi:hypothetical protein